MAASYGVVWHDDLFGPAGEDSRYTVNVEGFLGAQQEWLQASLPERSTLLPTDEYGSCTLPKKAERVYGKASKGDLTGYYLNPQTGEVRTVAYRMPVPKKVDIGKNATKPDGGDDKDDAVPIAKGRPDVTQRGEAIIGDLRTDALHEALKEGTIDDHTLLGLLVIAFAAMNVVVQYNDAVGVPKCGEVACTLVQGGVLTTDSAILRAAARAMLTAVLSCRQNMTNSGTVARLAGDAIGASLRLPNMATEAFLSCLSKAGVERAATAEGVRIERLGKDTRARLIERFKDGLYVYPPARFAMTAEDRAAAKAADPRYYVPGQGWGASPVGVNQADPIAKAPVESEQGATGDAPESDPDNLDQSENAHLAIAAE